MAVLGPNRRPILHALGQLSTQRRVAVGQQRRRMLGGFFKRLVLQNAIAEINYDNHFRTQFPAQPQALVVTEAVGDFVPLIPRAERAVRSPDRNIINHVASIEIIDIGPAWKTDDRNMHSFDQFNRLVLKFVGAGQQRPLHSCFASPTWPFHELPENPRIDFMEALVLDLNSNSRMLITGRLFPWCLLVMSRQANQQAASHDQIPLPRAFHFVSLAKSLRS